MAALLESTITITITLIFRSYAMYKIRLLIMIFAVCNTVGLLCAQIPPTVTFNPETGNYDIRYDGVGGVIELEFIPATKIAPSVESSVSWDAGKSKYLYQYTLFNGSNSAQKLQAFRLRVVGNEIKNETSAPDSGWHVGKYSYTEVFSWADTLYGRSGIAPGHSQSGFSIYSKGLPGIVECYLQGNAVLTPIVFPDEPPEEISEQLKPIEQFTVNSIRLKTLGPVAPPVCEEFLTLLGNHLAETMNLGWITDFELLTALQKKLGEAAKAQQDGSWPFVALRIEQFKDIVEASSAKIHANAQAILTEQPKYFLSHCATAKAMVADIRIFPPNLTHDVKGQKWVRARAMFPLGTDFTGLTFTNVTWNHTVTAVGLHIQGQQPVGKPGEPAEPADYNGDGVIDSADAVTNPNGIWVDFWFPYDSAVATLSNGEKVSVVIEGTMRDVAIIGEGFVQVK